MYTKILIVLVIVLVYLISAHELGKDREEHFYIRFDTTSIYGKLEYVKIKYHLCELKIEGIDNKFYFDPVTSSLNENKIFEYTAKRGDLVIKPAHSDTLILKKNGKVYQYKFRKPVD